MFQSTAIGPSFESPLCDEPTLDQLLADPIVQQLMHRDRVNEPDVRRLLREVSAARSAPRIVDHPATREENATARLLHETVELRYRFGEVTSSEQ
jgi:hypothetical protein